MLLSGGSDGKQTLTVTISPDSRAALRAAGLALFLPMATRAKPSTSKPGLRSSRVWPKSSGPCSTPCKRVRAVRELGHRLERDMKRVHEDAGSLVEQGLIEPTERGGLVCWELRQYQGDGGAL